MPLTSRQTRFLRATAHHLSPTVWVGQAGATDAVVAKVDAELIAHELIKVRFDVEDRKDLRAEVVRMASATRSEVAQVIGKIAVLYRRRAEKATLELPRG